MMHLEAVGRMMNQFAATGNINYAKRSRLYLQLTPELPTNYPLSVATPMLHGTRASCIASAEAVDTGQDY